MQFAFSASRYENAMATFYANPNDENEPWIEKAAVDGLSFRVWHVVFFCFSGFVVAVVLISCCVRIRVPRTNQDIEADYRRKKLAGKFRERLKLIQNHEMDEIDLERALEIIQEDYRQESRTIDDRVYADFNLAYENTENLKAEPQAGAKAALSE